MRSTRAWPSRPSPCAACLQRVPCSAESRSYACRGLSHSLAAETSPSGSCLGSPSVQELNTTSCGGVRALQPSCASCVWPGTEWVQRQHRSEFAILGPGCSLTGSTAVASKPPSCQCASPGRHMRSRAVRQPTCRWQMNPSRSATAGTPVHAPHTLYMCAYICSHIDEPCILITDGPPFKTHTTHPIQVARCKQSHDSQLMVNASGCHKPRCYHRHRSCISNWMCYCRQARQLVDV